MARMSRIIASIVVIGALSACGAAAAGRSAPARPCGPASARTLAVSGSARVYAVGRLVSGCAAGGGGRHFALGTTNLCHGSVQVQAVTVAGRLAAFGTLSCGVDTGSGVVQVRRLTDGRTLFTHGAAGAPGPESFTTVTAIAADAAGDVAWIARASSIVRHTASTAVYAAAGATVRQLDAGTAILSDSLRLNGTTVSWQHGTQRRSGRL